MVVEVRIRFRRQLPLGDQLRLWVVDRDGIDEAQLRQRRLIEHDRRWVAKSSGYDQPCREVLGVDQLQKLAHAVVDRDRRDPLPDQGIEAAETLSHAGARPHRPLDGPTAAVRISRLELLCLVAQPFVGQCVVGLAVQTDAGDDGTEGGQQFQLTRIDRREQIPEPIDFR